MVYIGIDVGGTGIKIGVVDEQGQLIHQGDAGRPSLSGDHRGHGPLRPEGAG